MTRQRRIAYLALLGNTLIWALAIPIAKRGFVAGLSPFEFLFWRYVLAAVVSVPIVALRRGLPSVRRVFRGRTLAMVAGLEVLGTLVALGLLYLGVERTGAVEASLITVTWPVFVTIGGVAWLREREERHELVGLGVTLVGILVLVGTPLLNGVAFGRGTLLGNVMILASNLAVAAYYLLAKRWYRGLDKWAVTHVSFWVGVVGFLLIGSLTAPLVSPEVAGPLPGSGNLLWLLLPSLYMGILGSVVALTLYLIGQDKIEASEAAVFTYLQPVVAVPAAMLLLGERVSAVGLVGAVLVAAGVVITEMRRWPRWWR